ncbi:MULTISPECIES: baeRF11 domain-containing protein [unclassified Gordonia (in: high G+C Gram-positive bacteria)]
MARYELPTLEDLRDLGVRQENAITIYAETSPAPDEREDSYLNAKSAFDRAVRELRESGIRHATEEALREQWEKVRTDEAWARLSKSLAIFLSPSQAQVFILPNRLENQMQVGTYFDLGQIVRAVTSEQTAYALTLSANGWNLWKATPTTVATEMPLTGDHAVDVADATNRATIRDRGHVRRLAGDEGKKVLLEKYAKRVAEAVRAELAPGDPNGEQPLFLFATDPLLDMYRAAETTRRVIAVPGASDELRADEIDAAIRAEMPALNAERDNALVERIADGVARGLVATDLADISKAAAGGAVDTLVYEFTVDIFGHIDAETGDLTYDDEGYDLLSKIVVAVLGQGGTVVAVRASEITSSVWNGTAVAGLRYPMS